MGKNSKYKFMQHQLSDAERLWLLEASSTNSFDPRAAKVKLRDELPTSFSPNTIDYRFYAFNRPTLLGIYLIDPDNPIFQVVDTVIRAIKSLIIANPKLERITANEIASDTGLSETDVSRSLGHLGEFGRFFSSANGAQSTGYSLISLQGEDAYDEYIRYKTLNDLLEERYERGEKSNRSEVSAPLISPFEFGNAANEPPQVKRDTAFVIMAIDRDNALLEDSYNTIKETSSEFGIKAYRADEIEHQDQITKRILLEIQTSEFLIADLSNERPNVYYEVGYAHAINKKPILYRGGGTKLHFDLSVHNVPEYKNQAELKAMLRKRWEAILGRVGKTTNGN